MTSAATVLTAIAEATGGQAFFPPSVKELDAVYEQRRERNPRPVHDRIHVDQRSGGRRPGASRGQAGSKDRKDFRIAVPQGLLRTAERSVEAVTQPQPPVPSASPQPPSS